jgi:homoserine kinase type II
MAVYTEVPDDLLRAFVGGYGIGEVLSAKGIAEGVENTNYVIETTAGRFILTLYEKRVREADLPFFLGLVEHLARAGVACPTPLHDAQGRAYSTLCGRPASIVTFLNGMWTRRPAVAQCAAVGGALASLHAAAADFPLTRANALTIGDWPRLAATAGERADTVSPGLAAVIAEELEFLEANWPSALPFGVIHGDLFPDNVFFLRETLSGLIDFYFACNDFLAYDVAVCLNAWCFETDGAFNVTKGRALIGAYAAARPLSSAELVALPVLARGSALRFLLTRLVDWLSVPPGALVKPKDPLEYLRKLRFHQRVDDARAYGWEGA